MTWLSVIIAGMLTYITRMTMITLVDRRVLSTKLKQVLGFVPAAVFPAIIFPAIFLDNSGSLIFEDNPKIIAAIIATIIGIFSRSIIATIFSGLASYWFIIFVI